MKRKIIKETLLIGILLFAIMLVLSFELNAQLEGSELCNSCHQMQPYFSSYINPQQGSLIANHKLTCIQCHSNKSVYDAKKDLAIEIIFHKFISDSISSPVSELKTNCTKCHSTPHDYVHPKNLTTCTECHWAHTSLITEQNISSYIIPIGPHKNQSCRNCHGNTFQIPRCIKCHTGHGEEKTDNSLCLGCHLNPHIPQKPGIFPNNTVTFTGNLSFEACQPCHEKEYLEMTNTPTQHTDMGTCTRCHKSHGQKPRCSNCHEAMRIKKHFDGILKCNNCHSTSGRRLCQDCHGRTHEWSALTAVVNSS